MMLIWVQESYMSTEDRDDNDPLQSLIAEILEAENQGETVDRERLIDEHPDQAWSTKPGRRI